MASCGLYVCMPQDSLDRRFIFTKFEKICGQRDETHANLNSIVHQRHLVWEL